MNDSQALGVYDHAGSFARMGNDTRLFCDMVGFLRQDGPRCLQELQAALAQQDSQRARHAAHALKGMVANFGAARAELAARNVEQGTGRLSWTELSSSTAELALALDELLAALTPYFSVGDPV
ncbi:MAG: Hpt domain-containing protein [Pirellulaceae bacterium]|nr:Hpt domain-containing protein [Pirellulaceae bacterium]